MKVLTLLLILCAPVALLAQTAKLAPLASGGQINAAVYNDAAHGSLFPGLDPSLKRFGVVITNTTNQPVVATQIRWDWTDPDGKPRILIEQKATIGTYQPIAGANSTFLMLPRQAPTAPGGRVMSAGFKMPAGLLTTPTVKVTIDTMILGDGQVIGPDNGHLQARLEARSQAVEMLRQIINAAKAQGRDPLPDIQQAIANAPPALRSQLALQTQNGKSARIVSSTYPLPKFYRK